MDSPFIVTISWFVSLYTPLLKTVLLGPPRLSIVLLLSETFVLLKIIGTPSSQNETETLPELDVALSAMYSTLTGPVISYFMKPRLESLSGAVTGLLERVLRFTM